MKTYTSFEKHLDIFITRSKLLFPTFFILLWGIFEITFTLGGIVSTWIESGMNALYSSFDIENIFFSAVYGGIVGISMYLPNIIILYFFLFLLTDSGIMERISYVFDRYTQKVRLSCGNFLTLFMGFGCTVSAVISTKTIKDPSEKILVTMLLPFMSCSAKMPVYMLFVSVFISPQYQSTALLGIYIFGILLGILSHLILSRFFIQTGKKCQISVPRYRLPKVGPIIRKIYRTLWDFVTKIGIYILPFSILLSLAFTFPQGQPIENTYGGRTSHYIHTIFEPLGFTEEMSVAAVAGLVGKEIIVSTLGSLYYIQDDSIESIIHAMKGRTIPFASGVSFIVFTLLYTPCIGAIIAVFRENGKKWGSFFIIYTISIAWFVSFIIYSLLFFFT